MKINDVLTEGWQDGMKHLGNAWKALTGGDNDAETDIDRLTQASGRAFQEQWVRMIANLRHTYKDKEDQGLGEAARQLASMFMKIGTPMLAPGTNGTNDLMVKRAWTGKDYATGQPKSTPAIYAGNKTVKQLFDTIIAETKAGRERGSAVAQAFDRAADEALAEMQRKQYDPYAQSGKQTQPALDNDRTELAKYHGQTLSGTEFDGLVNPDSDEYENAIIPIQYVNLKLRKKLRDGSDGDPIIRSYVKYDGQWYIDTNDDPDEYDLDEWDDQGEIQLLDTLIARVKGAVGGQSIQQYPQNILASEPYGSKNMWMQRHGTLPDRFRSLSLPDALKQTFRGQK